MARACDGVWVRGGWWSGGRGALAARNRMEEAAGGDEVVGEDTSIKVRRVRLVRAQLKGREAQRLERLKADRVAFRQALPPVGLRRVQAGERLRVRPRIFHFLLHRRSGQLVGGRRIRPSALATTTALATTLALSGTLALVQAGERLRVRPRIFHFLLHRRSGQLVGGRRIRPSALATTTALATTLALPGTLALSGTLALTTAWIVIWRRLIAHNVR